MEEQNEIFPEQESWQIENVAYSKIDTYRTNDGTAFFTFGCLFGNGQIQVDVLHMPIMRSIDTESETSSLERSNRGGLKVRMPSEPINNEVELWPFLAQWAETLWNDINAGDPEII